jgi:hypothetical protein
MAKPHPYCVTHDQPLDWCRPRHPDPLAGIRYPDIHVQLTGEDGNASAILGKVTKALCHQGHGDQVPAFLHEAMAGDYDELLTTVMRWVDVS